MALGRDTLTKILGDQVQVITFRNLQKWAFEKNPILSKLLKTQIEKVLDVMKISNYKAGDVILKKGSAANQKIIVIVEGALKKVIFADFTELNCNLIGEIGNHRCCEGCCLGRRIPP